MLGGQCVPNLPAGSRIDYLRLYSYDESSVEEAGRALITRYDGRGDYDEYGHVCSAGGGGYESTLSDFIGHVVDTTNWSYVLMWRSRDPGSDVRLCGLRVAYRVPLFRVALPLVLRNAPR